MPSDNGPKIRGAVIKDARDWMRTAYGPDAYKDALAALSAEERVIVDGPILTSEWYPLPAWDKLQADSRRAVVRYSGASSAFRTSLINNFPSGLLFLLELNGAKNIDARISRDEIVDDKLVLEVTVLFNA